MKKVLKMVLFSSLILSGGDVVVKAVDVDTVTTDSSVIESDTSVDISTNQDKETTENTSETKESSKSEEVKKEDSKDVKKVKEEKKVSILKSSSEDDERELNYIKDSSNNLLNYRNFKYKYNAKENSLYIALNDEDYQKVEGLSSESSDNKDEINFSLSYNFKNNPFSNSETELGSVIVNIKDNTVRIDDGSNEYVSDSILKDENLLPMVGLRDNEVDGHAMLFTNKDNSRYVIQLDALNDYKTDELTNIDNKLFSFKTLKNHILVVQDFADGVRGFEHITKREVISSKISNETKYDNEIFDKKVIDSKAQYVLDTAYDYFYTSEDGEVVLNSNEISSTKLAYKFNGKGDLSFKIKGLDEISSLKQDKYYVSFNLDEKLKNDKTYKENIGKVIKKDFEIDFGKMRGTSEVHTITIFEEDKITVKVVRGNIVSSKPISVYALDLDIATLDAVYEEPKEEEVKEEVKEEPKEEVKEVKKEVVENLPKAGNNIGKSALLSTISLTSLMSLVYIFKRK